MAERKIALFGFSGEMMCFVHVLLNGLDFHNRGFDTKIVVEGASTTLIPELAEEEHPLHALYLQVMEKDLFDGACKACATSMDVAVSVQRAGIRLFDELNGHPSMAWYRERGYEIITF